MTTILRKVESCRLSGRRRLWATGVTCSALIIVFATSVARPQDMPVPMNIQLPLLLKVLSADRHLREGAGDELVIGVFYQPRYRASVTTMEALFDQATRTIDPPFPDQPLRLVPVPIEGEPNWDSLLTILEIDVCYLAPLRAMGIAALLQVTRTKGTVTCTGVPEYVESGVAVGLDVKGGKPQIVINIAAAKAEGIDFSSQLLKLARIVAKG